MGGKKRRNDCDPRRCGMELKIDGVMERFTIVSEKLTDNQVVMRLHIQKLSDSMEGLFKVHGRIDDLTKKVEENSRLLWKVLGGVSVAVTIGLLGVKLLLGNMLMG